MINSQKLLSYFTKMKGDLQKLLLLMVSWMWNHLWTLKRLHHIIMMISENLRHSSQNNLLICRMLFLFIISIKKAKLRVPNIGNYLSMSAGTRHPWQTLIYHIWKLGWFIYSITKSAGLMLFDFKLIIYCANIKSNKKTHIK